jgi:hypothetical protein
MSKFAGAWSRDYLRSVIYSLIAAAIVIPLGCMCVFIPMCVATQPEVDSTTALVVLVVPLSLFFLIVFGGMGVAAVGVLWRRARRLDAAFTPLGLRGSLYMLTGRQYHGTVEGRQVDAYFYRGPTLDLRVGTPLQTRLTVTEEAAVSATLARVFSYQPLALDAPGLQGLSISALDEDWARALLGSPWVQERLQRLVAGEGWALLRQVHLQPGTLYLRLYRNRNLFRYDISPQQARQWLDDLLALARIAESLPMPRVTAELTSAEHMVQAIRSRRAFLMIAIIVVLVVLAPICLILPLAALFVLGEAQ